MVAVAAHDSVGENGANHRYDDADHDLGDPILHGRGRMLEMSGKI